MRQYVVDIFVIILYFLGGKFMDDALNMGEMPQKKTSFFNSLVFKLIVGIGLGILVGNYAPLVG